MVKRLNAFNNDGLGYKQRRQSLKSSSPIRVRVNVSNRSGGGNHHFRDLETIANDVRKAEKT